MNSPSAINSQRTASFVSLLYCTTETGALHRATVAIDVVFDVLMIKEG